MKKTLTSLFLATTVAFTANVSAEDTSWFSSVSKDIGLSEESLNMALDKMLLKKRTGGRRDRAEEPEVLPRGEVLVGQPLFVNIEEEAHGKVISFSIKGAWSLDKPQNAFYIPADVLKDGETYQWTLKTTKGAYSDSFVSIPTDFKASVKETLDVAETKTKNKKSLTVLQATVYLENMLDYNAISSIAEWRKSL